MLDPALYIVPTPIGNLEDITQRAIKILSEADIIACEDTRHTGNLLKLLNVRYNKLLSYHEHNETERAEEIVVFIKSGKSVALVSDAGTPLISDPGYRVVTQAVSTGIKIIPLPGANAILPALVASGLPVHTFTFLGFIPQKKGRKTFLEQIEKSNHTCIFYESTHRIDRLLEEIKTIFELSRKVVIAKEISKFHENFIRTTVGTASEDMKKVSDNRGEFVILFEGKK